MDPPRFFLFWLSMSVRATIDVDLVVCWTGSRNHERTSTQIVTPKDELYTRHDLYKSSHVCGTLQREVTGDETDSKGVNFIDKRSKTQQRYDALRLGHPYSISVCITEISTLSFCSSRSIWRRRESCYGEIELSGIESSRVRV